MSGLEVWNRGAWSVRLLPDASSVEARYEDLVVYEWWTSEQGIRTQGTIRATVMKAIQYCVAHQEHLDDVRRFLDATYEAEWAIQGDLA